MTTTEHLHLIREKLPTVEFGDPVKWQTVEVWCPHCAKRVFVLHLDLPPINPKARP